MHGQQNIKTASLVIKVVIFGKMKWTGQKKKHIRAKAMSAQLRV